MDPLFLAAQACGWVGLAGCCLWTFARTRAGMIAVQLGTGWGFLLHWALLGHWTAALSTGLTLALAAASAALEGPAGSRRVRAGRALFLALLPVIAGVTLMSWGGPESLFAGLGTAVACLARWQTDAGRFRGLLLASAAPWLVHNLAVGSLPAVAADLFCLGRAGLGVWQARRSRARSTAAAAAAAA